MFGEPFVFPHTLYTYQRDGIEWLRQRDSALLADDMGLGKTVQTIVALRHLFRTGDAAVALVVCPKAVQSSWTRHLADWAPELRVQLVAGTPDERKLQWRALRSNGAHVGIVTYATLRNDEVQARAHALDVPVLDEAQNLKNPDTQQTKAVRAVPSRKRWALTGTPVENAPQDLASILRVIDPKIALTRWSTEGAIKELSRPFILRRLKEDVLKDLPSLVTNIEYIALSDNQRAAYDRAERDGIIALERGDVSITHVLV